MGKIKFGTDGWRDIIGENFTFDNVKIVAQAIADYVNNDILDKEELRGKELVVGYDTRKYSEDYARTVAEVLAANNIKVILSDRITTTPAVSFAIKKRHLTGGVMITASHNPAIYNGIKYKAYYSGSADMGIINKIENNLHKTKIKSIALEEAKKKGLIKMDDLLPDQLNFITQYIDMGLLKKSNYKVLIDVMYGAGGRYMENILKETGCKADTIHSERDVKFGGINPEPVEQNLKELIKKTKNESYDIGIATDGDVDRVGCVTPDGLPVTGQYIMALLLWHFVEDRKMKGSVVTTVCGTTLLKKICEKYGLKLHETRVGFKYICDIMRQEDVLVGGEETGGIGFKNYIPERDGILSGLLLLEMMAHRKKPILEILKDMYKTFGSYYYKRLNVKCDEDKKNNLIPRLKANPLSSILDKKVVEVNTLDGIKFTCEDSSWLLFRLSGTEPIVRVYSEAADEEYAKKILDFGKKVLEG